MTKKLNKLAAVIVVASMLISCLCFGGNALDLPTFTGAPTGDEAMSIGLTASADSVQPGDVVMFTVRLSNNYNAITMFWPVLYSTDFFEVVEGSLTSPINDVTAAPGTTAEPTTDPSFIPAKYADSYSVFGIQWVAGATADKTVGVFNSGSAVDCFTFQLKVKEGATGSGSVLIPPEYDKYYYSGVNDPSDALTYYETSTPFAFTFADPITYTLASAADPELVAAEGFDVQFISFDGDDTQYLCGFDVVDIVDNGNAFTDQFVVNNGTYTVSDSMFATGTVVTVYNAAGEVFAEYEIIYFGDANGDGAVDAADISVMADIYNFIIEPTGALYYAADIYADDYYSICVDSADISAAADIYNFVVSSDLNMQTHRP